MRFPWLSRQLWCVRRRIPIAPIGLDAPTPARVVGLPPRGGSTFFRSERKYQRKPAARRLQRRPTSLCAVGFGLREPNGWTPRIYSGRPIPAVRPEQSDHVPWADCPQGLSSTSVRCAHPPGKSPLLPTFERGSSQCRAQWSWPAFAYGRSALVLAFFRRQNGRAFFPPLPIAALLPRSWRGAYSKGCQLGYCIAACAFSQHRKRDLILSIDFLQRKRPAGFYIHAGHYCEP